METKQTIEQISKKYDIPLHDAEYLMNHPEAEVRPNPAYIEGFHKHKNVVFRSNL